MRVTTLSQADAEQYRAIMLYAYEHAEDSFTSTVDERAAEPLTWWVSRVANPAGLYLAFGVYEETSLVGVVALEFSAKPKTQHKALVVGLYVMPAARGKGVARSLMQTALSFAKTRPKLTVVQLEVTEGNNAAIALYQSLGFKQYGVEPMAVLTLLGYRNKVHMWVQLTGSHPPSLTLHSSGSPSATR